MIGQEPRSRHGGRRDAEPGFGLLILAEYDAARV